MRKYFLDSNAHVPMNDVVLEAYLKFNKLPAAHGNPNSINRIGRESAEYLEGARKKIARYLGAESGQFFFTRGSTQACEWAIKIIKNRKCKIHCSPIEHPAVYMSLQDAEFLNVDKNGKVLFDQKYDVVSCIYVQNEIGVIQDFSALDCSFLFSDMSQAAGKIKINLSKMNVDMAVFGAHKFGGPSGVGILYLKDPEQWIEFGIGSRYYTDIVGTPDVAGIYLTGIALEEAIKTMEIRRRNMLAFRDTFERGLKNFGCIILGEGNRRVDNTTFFKINGVFQDIYNDGVGLLNKLSELGIYVGLGSACGSMHTEVSKVAQALGHSEEGHQYIRVSQWGSYNDLDAKYILGKLKRLR
jgi:cysteine desulfurase